MQTKVVPIIIEALSEIRLIRLIFLDSTLTKTSFSIIAKAAKIYIGYDVNALMHTQISIKMIIPLIGNKLIVKIGKV